jgi:hypothetical protein
MIPRVEWVRYMGGYKIHIRFTDGTEGVVDLGDELHGEMFVTLRKKTLFKQVGVHPEFRTLCWPNGADLAPEYLYEKVLTPE